MAYNAAEMKQKIAEHLKGGDMPVKEIAELVHASLPALRRWLAQMAEGGEVFHYTTTNWAVRIYTLDRSKHREDAYSRVKHTGNRHAPQGIIPGARVFLFDDPEREDINRAIMLSQRTKTKVAVYPGTSFGEVTLRMPG
jgi:transposase-like protein